MAEQQFNRYVVETLINGKKGKYRKTDTEFTYYTKKQFKQVQEDYAKTVAEQAQGTNTELQPIGFIRLKPCELQEIDDTRNVNGVVNTSIEVVERQRYDTVIFEKELPDAAAYTRRNVKVVGLETQLLEKKPFLTYVKGYVAVGADKFIQWHKSLLPILLLLLGLLFGGCLITYIVTRPEPAPYIETDPDYDDEQRDWDGALPKSGKDSTAAQDTTTFPGYSTVIVTQDNPVMELVNPSINTVDFRYTVLNAEGTELYTTSKIRPGKCVPFSIGKLFNATGSYELNLIIKTFDVESGVECTSVTIPIVLVIE